MDDKRLIDAGELIGYLHEKTFIDGDDRSMVYKAIEEQPSVKAEPVKHGRWIEKIVSRMKWIPYDDDNVNPDDVDIERMTEQKCSYCKRWTIKFTGHIELDYCPLCGAKMDLKEI